MVSEKTPGGFAVTIAERGRGDESVSTAEVFTWSELPELLAAEDLFEGAWSADDPTAGGVRADCFARVEEDDDEDDFEDDDEDDFEDDDEEYEDDEEESEEDDEEEDGEEWEEVDDDEEGDDFEDDDEDEDEDWEEDDEDEDWDDDEDD